MRGALPFLLSSLLSVVLHAQPLDALIYNELAQKAYDGQRPDSAYYYAQKAFSLAKEESNKKQQWKAHQHLGYYFEIKGEYGKALDHYIDALRLANGEKELLISYDKIGTAYGMASEFGQSIENLNIALRHAHFPEDKLLVYNNLGRVYAKQDRFVKAREYFQMALDIAEVQGNTREKINSYAFLGQLASREEKYAEAISYYQKVISLTGLLGLNNMRPYNLMILGKQYHHLNKFDSAHYYYNLAVVHTRSVGKPIVEAYIQIAISESFLAQNKLNQALQSISLADSLAKVWTITGQEKEVFRIKASIFEKKGNAKEAEFYKSKLKNLEDSIKQSIDEVKVKEAEQKFIKTEVVEEKADYKNLSIVVVVIVASLLTFVFLRRNVQHDSVSKNEHGKALSQHAEVTSTPVSTLLATESKLEFINLISQNGEKPMRLERIIYIEKEGKLCEACTEEGMFKLRKTLAELEDELPSKQFFRINRSTIIQLDKMLNYSFWEHDKYIVRMKEGEKREFVMSRDRLKFLQQALGMPS